MEANRIEEKIYKYGADILVSEGMQKEKTFVQHGSITCYDHSLRVAEKSLELAEKCSAYIDERSLVRGALLHDYFLYDWHEKDGGHRLHGFFHAERALHNARRDFNLNFIERDIIRKHMFPLNITPPKFRESWIVTWADKLCAAEETTRVLRLAVTKTVRG